MSEIRVELRLADGSFATGMLRAGQSLRDFEAQLLRNNRSLQAAYSHTGRVIDTVKKLDGANKGFLDTLRDVSIITTTIGLAFAGMSSAMNGWFGEIVRVNAEMQRLHTMMRGMAMTDDPMKEAAENVRYLREMAMNTPFALDTLANSFVKLQSTGIDPMAGALQSLADGIAGFGGSDDQFERATVAITQMSGKGVIQMEELRQQLGEHMPRAVELMARSMGVGVAELLKEISKGTMAAGPALEALYAEMDRVYGGSAKAMMQTFQGQMKQTTTLWQNLLLTVGGMNKDTMVYSEGGFFMTITQQLKDLNQVLASPVADGFAASVGAGLTNIIQFVRQAVEAVITFRRELQTIAIVAGGAFAMRAAAVGISSLIGSLGLLTNNLKILRIEWAATSTMFMTGVTGFRALSTAGLGLQMTLTGIGMGIKLVGTAIMTTMPWVAAIGLAVYTAAQYFDWFGDSARKAYEDLEQFGAKTREEAEATIAARTAQYDEEIAIMQRRAEQEKQWGGGVTPETNAELKRLMDERNKILADAPELIRTGMDNEDRIAADDYRRRLDEQFTVTQRAYDREAKAEMQRIEQAKANGENVIELEKDRKEELYRLREEALRENIDFLEREENATKDAMSLAGDDPDLKRQLNDRLAVITTELVTYYDQLNQLTTMGVDGFGIEHLVSPDGGAGAFADGEKHLKSLRDGIRETQLQFHGASKAAAELEVAIARGDYGSIKEGGEEVAQLHEQLRQAVRQKEALDELMEGRSEAEKDAERARKDALQERIDLMVREEEFRLQRKLTQGEINNLKIDAGWYDGIGSEENINDHLDTVLEKFGSVDIGSADTGEAIRKAFADTATNAITQANNELARFNANLVATASAVNGMNFGSWGEFGGAMSGTPAIPVAPGAMPAEKRDRMALAMERLMGHGWTRAQAAGIVGNVGGESAFNPNARNPGDGRDGSDSIGIAQWNSDRAIALQKFAADRQKPWNDFLTQIDFINHELNGSEAEAGRLLRLAGTPEQASNTVMRKYERPADWAMAESGGRRAGYAVEAYNMVDENYVPSMLAGNAALSDRAEIVTQLTNDTNELRQANDEATDDSLEVRRLNMVQERIELVDDLRKRIGLTTADTIAAGTELQRVYEQIDAGALGESRDRNAPEYADAIALAKELDALNEKLTNDATLKTELENDLKAIEEERLEINRELADAQAAAADPNYVPESATITRLNAQMDAYIAKLTQVYGAEHDLVQQAIETKQNMLRDARLTEATEEGASLMQQAQQRNVSMMTEAQQRQHAMQQQLAGVDAWIARARAAGMEEVEITRQAEAMKASIRQQFAQQMDPMAAQMAEWGDLQGQLAQKSTQWMDSLAGGITDLIMGTGDLRSVINGILKDMINMLVKYMMSGMKGGGSGKASKGNKAGKASKAGKAFGVAHTGGIVGGTLRNRRAGIGAFAGAPRYHTGGIVGPTLHPSEVPIIAQKGEGVFTKEQMANLQPAGGGQVVTIDAPITVHGSAGTPEQNQDLAKRMRREMEGGMRALVADELRKQTKAGNMMNTRSRS